MLVTRGEQPMVLQGSEMPTYAFAGADDAVVLAFKVSNDNIYAMGITIPKLKEWTPAAGVAYDDAAILTSWKLPAVAITSVRALLNTETDKLRDKTDALIPHLQLFKLASIKSLKHLSDISVASSEKNLGRAVSAAALRWKKAAKARGDTTRDDSESVAGGGAAAEKAKKLEASLLPNMKYYDEHLENRFITLTTYNNKLTEESFDAAREFLRYAISVRGR